MWDTLNTVVEYLLKEGGIFGLLVIISFIWIGFREWTLVKSKKNEKEIRDSNAVTIEESAVIKERQKSQIKILESNETKLKEIQDKISEITNHIDGFINANQKNKQLTAQLQQVNDERVEELKEILGSYNKTMNELALTLEKIKFVLKTRLGED